MKINNICFNGVAKVKGDVSQTMDMANSLDTNDWIALPYKANKITKNIDEPDYVLFTNNDFIGIKDILKRSGLKMDEMPPISNLSGHLRNKFKKAFHDINIFDLNKPNDVKAVIDELNS